MSNFTSLFRKIGIVVFVLFLAFLVYANIEPAPLHTYAPPSGMALFKCNDLKSEEKAQEVNTFLEKATGITAYTVNLNSQLISIAFRPDETNIDVLRENLKKSCSIDPIVATYENDAPPKAECPIPHSVFANFEKIKYAFCFR